MPFSDSLPAPISSIPFAFYPHPPFQHLTLDFGYVCADLIYLFSHSLLQFDSSDFERKLHLVSMLFNVVDTQGHLGTFTCLVFPCYPFPSVCSLRITVCRYYPLLYYYYYHNINSNSLQGT